MMETKQFGEVQLKIYDTPAEMGQAAAEEAAQTMVTLLARKEAINCIFAAAPSQNDFLAALIQKNIPWDRVNAYHMDEYIGFEIGHPQSFNGFLSSTIFDRVPLRTVSLIDGRGDPARECERYAALLEAEPPDIVFMGIGENGHIAFNDPPVADFQDPKKVKVVTLELACRMQQVHDKCFSALDAVPTQALTLTIPALVSAPHLFCIVPGERKAAAVAAALTGEISEACPASILRKRKGCRMYIDRASAASL